MKKISRFLGAQHRANQYWNISATARFHQEPKQCILWSHLQLYSPGFYKLPIHTKLQHQSSLFWSIIYWQCFLINGVSEDSLVNIDAVDYCSMCILILYSLDITTFNKARILPEAKKNLNRESRKLNVLKCPTKVLQNQSRSLLSYCESVTFLCNLVCDQIIINNQRCFYLQPLTGQKYDDSPNILPCWFLL